MFRKCRVWLKTEYRSQTWTNTFYCDLKIFLTKLRGFSIENSALFHNIIDTAKHRLGIVW